MIIKLFCLLFLSIPTIAGATNLLSQHFSEQLGDYHACFILYDIKQDKIISKYNPNNRCAEHISPNSTFKIALSLMAFEKKLINQTTVFKWQGESGILPEHEQDQTPNSWLKYSVVWVSQKITPMLGMESIKHFLADFKYGNEDFSGDPGLNNGLHYAWLSSSLKISAYEQLAFLRALQLHQLSVHKDAVRNTKKNMYLGTLDNGASYYGKTGSGRHGANERQQNPSLLRDGWFVGFVEFNNNAYIFVSNLTDKVKPAATDKAYGGQIIKPKVLNLLNHYFKE